MPVTNHHENSQLTDQQLQAIFLLVQGCSDREVVEQLEVARETVCRWRHDNPHFIAELNRRRKALWDGAHDKLRGLLGKTTDALEHALDQYDPKVAIELLKAIGVYGNVGAHGEPTKPEGVRLKWAEVWANEELSRNGPSDDPLASLIMPTNRHVQLTRQRLEELRSEHLA